MRPPTPIKRPKVAALWITIFPSTGMIPFPPCPNLNMIKEYIYLRTDNPPNNKPILAPTAAPIAAPSLNRVKHSPMAKF
jgi:hypothetical protein